MMGIPADQNGGAQLISDALHIENRIIGCVETYMIAVTFVGLSLIYNTVI